MKSPQVIMPDWPCPASVKAFTTTRIGGFSPSPFDNFNFSADHGDAPENVMRNRALLCEHFALPKPPTWIKQVHGIEAIDASLIYPTPPAADSSYSLQPNIVCAVQTADCLPVLLCDKKGTMVAAIHAGWRGLAAGAIEAARDCLPSTQLMAWMGPAIGPKVFEIGPEVREIFLDQDPNAHTAFMPAEKTDHWLGDLYALARMRLARAGVTDIYGGNYCTYTQSDLFYSYRREKQTGRMVSLIWFSAPV